MHTAAVGAVVGAARPAQALRPASPILPPPEASPRPHLWQVSEYKREREGRGNCFPE
jgi:hypothetical protein